MTIVALPSSLWLLAIAPIVGGLAGMAVSRLRPPAPVLPGPDACPACRRRGERLGAPRPGMALAALGVAGWAAAVTAGLDLWVSCLLGWALLALAAADARAFLLPDALTLPLLAAGLAHAAAIEPEALPARVAGAAAGLAVILLARGIYLALRGREGIGLGDAKLLAAAGAWVGWEGLPGVLLIATVCALAGVLPRALRAGGIPWTERVPFGIFLCIGFWVVWLHGPLGGVS